MSEETTQPAAQEAATPAPATETAKPAPAPAAATITETASTKKTLTITEEELAAMVQEQLKPIKGKLDSAFAERDAAQAKADALEKKERDAEIARLTEEGKHKEAFDMQLAEKDAKLAALAKRNTELSRDNEVTAVLSTYQFRGNTAAEMTHGKVLAELVQTDDGKWVHKSGISVRDFMKVFAENEDNAFLFKAKVSSGTGSQATSPTPGTTQKSSIFAMTQEEVLQHISEGKPLPNRN
jgi:hypothetical protein